MEWLATLLLAASCCAAICEGSAGPFCEGLNSCHNIFTLEVCKGDSRSLHLPLNADGQKLVTKCDPETKTWEDEILAAPGVSKPLMNKTISISLMGENFTVHDSEKIEGLYKIEQYLHDHCLAIVNVTVLDLPLCTAVTPSSVTETAEAVPPGTENTFASTIILIILGLLITFIAVGVCVQKWIKSKCRAVCVQKWIKSKRRPKEDTCEVDPEKLVNGSRPHQQQETTTV